jgi:hypothetical protein
MYSKVLTNIIYLRMEPNTENVIGEYQSSFRKGRSTIQQLFTVKQMLEGKRTLVRPRCRRKDNMKIDLQEVEWGGGAWTGSSWLRIGTVGRHL